MLGALKKLIGIATTVDDYIERGDRYVQLADWENAASNYARAVRMEPTDPVIHCRLGTSLISSDVRRAIGCLDEAIRLDPDYAEAFYQRGVAWRNDGHAHQAIADLEEAIRLDPDHGNAHVLLGNLKTILATSSSGYERVYRAEALREFSAAIRLHPQQSHLYEMRAGVLRELQRDTEAEADERKARELRDLPENRSEDQTGLARVAVTSLSDSTESGAVAPGPSGWIPFRLHMFLRILLPVLGTVAGFAGAAFVIWKYTRASPLSAVVFFGSIFAGWLLPTAIIQLLVPARCPECGGRAYLEGQRPMKYVCRRCGHVHKTAWSRPRRYA